MRVKASFGELAVAQSTHTQAYASVVLPFKMWVAVIAILLLSSGSSSVVTLRVAARQSLQRQLLGTTAALLVLPSMARSDEDNAFREAFPYAAPSDFIRYLDTVVPEQGRPDKVLAAMDRFAAVFPMYKLTPRKAAILTGALKKAKPRQCLEIGSFFGYSALHMLVADRECKVTLMEGNDENIEVIKSVLSRAMGEATVQRRVEILPGLSSKSIGAMPERSREFEFVFLDHDKDQYLSDLRTLEQRRLLSEQVTIVADNVIFPGAPRYLEYVNNAYSTKIERADFERIGFETKYKAVEDGMSVSIRRKA